MKEFPIIWQERNVQKYISKSKFDMGFQNLRVLYQLNKELRMSGGKHYEVVIKSKKV